MNKILSYLKKQINNFKSIKKYNKKRKLSELKKGDKIYVVFNYNYFTYHHMNYAVEIRKVEYVTKCKNTLLIKISRIPYPINTNKTNKDHCILNDIRCKLISLSIKPIIETVNETYKELKTEFKNPYDIQQLKNNYKNLKIQINQLPTIW